MGIDAKLAAQATERLGEPVLAAAMVVPPGATLYRGYRPKTTGDAVGGPIVAALRSKADGAADGQAGTVPTVQGVLALTATRVVYFKKKALGVGVGDAIAQWPRPGLVFRSDASLGRYPALMIEFPDGSTCVMFGEKSWGLDGVAAAANR